MKLFLDCGAPSLYNNLAREKKSKGIMGSFLADRKKDSFEFLETSEYKDYKKKYIQCLVENAREFDLYTNLDIINNPEETWKNQLEFESYGLKPIPVFHFGSDIYWLKMLLEKRYDYIAMGGFIPNPVSVLQPALDDMWSNILTDKKGFPIVKVHGFAVTSARLVMRYPWYSCDSTSWAKIGIYGGICVPRNKNGRRYYGKSPHIVFLSNRSGKRLDVDGKHFDNLTKSEKEMVIQYLDELKIPLGKSSIKKVCENYVLAENEQWWNEGEQEVEVIEERGAMNQFEYRNRANIFFYLNLQKEAPKWPWPFIQSIKGFGL
jgi:hypothetical protein